MNESQTRLEKITTAHQITVKVVISAMVAEIR